MRHTHTHTQAGTHARTHTHTHTHTQAGTHARTHTHTHILSEHSAASYSYINTWGQTLKFRAELFHCVATIAARGTYFSDTHGHTHTLANCLLNIKLNRHEHRVSRNVGKHSSNPKGSEVKNAKLLSFLDYQQWLPEPHTIHSYTDTLSLTCRTSLQ